MADRSSKPSDVPATKTASVIGLRLAPQMLMMFRAFMASPQRNKILLFGIAIVAVIGATAFGQIKLNAWNQPFYDALARKDLREFLDQFVIFGIIAWGLLILNVAQAWLNQTTKVKLREGLVRDLFEEWLKPRRAFRLNQCRRGGRRARRRFCGVLVPPFEVFSSPLVAPASGSFISLIVAKLQTCSEGISAEFASVV